MEGIGVSVLADQCQRCFAVRLSPVGILRQRFLRREVSLGHVSSDAHHVCQRGQQFRILWPLRGGLSHGRDCRDGVVVAQQLGRRPGEQLHSPARSGGGCERTAGARRRWQLRTLARVDSSQPEVGQRELGSSRRSVAILHGGLELIATRERRLPARKGAQGGGGFDRLQVQRGFLRVWQVLVGLAQLRPESIREPRYGAQQIP